MSSNHSYLDDKQYTYEYFSQDSVCRLCWSETNGIKSIENESTTAEQILEYIGIDITTRTPNKVCNICINKIKSFINFKKCCQEAEKKLKIILSITFEENYVNPAILKKEADFELKLLADEVKKEKLDRLIIKHEKHSNFEIDDSVCDYDDLLPKDDNYCFICSLNFDSPEQTIKHNLEVHKTKENVSYKCRGCKKEFTSYARKTSHELRLCKVINEFNCNVCLQNLPTYELFESHMRAHESEQTNGPIVHECNKCFSTFETGDILRKHKRTTHKVKRKVEDKTEKIVCEVCGLIYSKRNIHVHTLIHTQFKKLKCPHCEYRATLQASLNIHIKLHTGERPFACDQCPYRCITSSNLNKHRKTHTGVKEYSCHICKKGYRYNASLRDHITSAHQGERKHKCKQCSAQYFHFKGLRKHMLAKHGRRVKKVKDDFIEVDSESYLRMSKNKSQEEAGMSHEELGMGHEEAGMGHEDRGMSHKEAGMGHKETGMGHEDSGMSRKEAGIGLEEGGMGHADAGMSHEEVGINHGKVEVGLEEAIISYCQ